jgi:hypothetical protein
VPYFKNINIISVSYVHYGDSFFSLYCQSANPVRPLRFYKVKIVFNGTGKERVKKGVDFALSSNLKKMSGSYRPFKRRRILKVPP